MNDPRTDDNYYDDIKPESGPSAAPRRRKRPTPGTMLERVLERLERGPLCSQAFYFESGLTHRIPAKISDLATLYGLNITSTECANPGHSHTARGAVEYRLHPTEQTEFPL